MGFTLSATRRDALRALCDTVVAPISHAPDAAGLWGRSASDVGVPAALEGLLTSFPADQAEGVGELLDVLALQGITRLSQASREQILRNLVLVGGPAGSGTGSLISLTLYLAYGLPDERGQNAFWPALGYPGPASPPPAPARTIEPLEVPAGGLELEADVCVVGSGAGGGLIAGMLASAGARVVVLEAGEHLTESDFTMLELPAFQRAYWRGGPTPTADGNITLQAGSCLGGGTTVNWTNCLRTRPWVREQWAQLGLDGVDGADFDRHLDAVLERISATDRCSDLNPPQQRMRDGAAALGWSFATVVRNTDPDRYDPASAGYLGFGDQSASKQGTLKTYLQDAADAGAEILVRTWAQRVLVRDGAAVGVEAGTLRADGTTAPVRVSAPHVVVAGGALESPALLLRSSIGGPGVGQHLRLHPCTAVFGIYPEDQRAWWGPPHAGLVDEFADVEDGYGFLVEGVQYTTGLTASALPWTSAAEHKDVMERVRFGASFVGLVRDHGGGQVTVDGGGQAVPTYDLSDPLDIRTTHAALDAMVRLHVAAGAVEIIGLAGGMPRWRRGDDTDAFSRRLQRVPLRSGGFRLFSAHQMGTCRMGADPTDSVAGPWGELHDVRGVWIGDGSALPTASGTNPMISIMALAHRTAETIADRMGVRRATAAPIAASAP